MTTTTEAHEALTAAMREYADAVRGDWSEFDGRREQGVIEAWIEEIRKPTATTLPEWRDRLGICPDGHGHWAGLRWGHCSPEDCPTQAKREAE
ncbi:hypothetical protein [Microbacterium sp. zg-YB36]|uniref:hypothetical protein n=1 Tax=Microbacterium sp. zg-YB36 TaxID=2969407 RepID=UPI00214B63A3|nr:hypothetical protein [Microbacterium sp. zg-YB36]MDL5351139.1 hypothetical protein [Microbacterium sp. zg-YB36]